MYSFSIISAFCSLALATVGNRAAALSDNPSAQHDLFAGGFTLALLIALLTLLVCLSATYFISGAPGIQQWDKEVFWTLSLIYIGSTPLLVINQFLYLFLEATGKASPCANGKTLITLLGSAGLCALFMLAGGSAFKYCAMAYFFTTELLTLLYLLRLTRGLSHYSLKHANLHIRYFMRTGIPVAAGLSGQKVYFYLLIERLASIDTHLVAQLSVFMTLVGLLLIPSIALSQLHSLHVSKQILEARKYYPVGLLWSLGLMVMWAIILWFAGKYLFLAVGGGLIDYTTPLYLTLVIFLTCNSLQGLALAHLRAQHETFTPHLIVNTMMLAILTPTLYTVYFANPSITTFLMLQSAATFMSFLLLCGRIFFVHRQAPSRTAEPRLS